MKLKIICIGIVSMFLLTSLASGMTISEKQARNIGVQGDFETWDKIIGDKGYNEKIHASAKTPDGAIILVYKKTSIINSDSQINLIKIDEFGNILWEKTIDDENNGRIYSIKSTMDNGFILVGKISISELDQYDIWLVKIEDNGDVEFNSNIDVSGEDSAYSVEENVFGHFLIIGDCEINEPSNPGGNAVLIKANSRGKLMDVKELDIDFNSYNDIIAISDFAGHRIGYVISGTEKESPCLKLMKINENAKVVNEYIYDSFGSPTEILSLHDGGFVLVGNIVMTDSTIMLMKIDKDFNFLWRKDYKEDKKAFDKSVIESNDGGFLICGMKPDYNNDVTDKYFTDFFGYLLKVDSYGEFEWSKKYHIVGNHNYIQNIINTNDGGYVLLADTIWEPGCYGYDFDDYHHDLWLIKIDGNGEFNDAPEKPETPDGPSKVKDGVENRYTMSGFDADSDVLFYRLDWGSDKVAKNRDKNWIGPLESGDEIVRTLSWSFEKIDKYELKIKLMDWHGYESEWADPLIVKSDEDKSKSYFLSNLFKDFFNNHPILTLLKNLKI